MPEFGPGTLTIGEVGSEIDVSCQINAATITASKDQGDSTTKLCGTVKPGATTYTYALTGNLDTDTDDSAGLFALSQASPGSEQPFTFTPNTPTETAASGTLVIDPLDFGGEEYGADMTSDFEFSLIGAPAYTYPDAPAPPALMTTRRVINGAGAEPLPATEPAPSKSKTSKTTSTSTAAA